MCHNPQMDTDVRAVTELVATVAAAVSRRVGAVSANVYEVILRDIPELRDDNGLLALLTSSVHSNIGTCLQILQHQIELSTGQAPAARGGGPPPPGSAGHVAARADPFLPARAHVFFRMAVCRAAAADQR